MSKKILKKTIIFLRAIVFFVLILSCNKSQVSLCNFHNPLKELSWLKEKINEFNLLTQEAQNLSIAIYQCRYGRGEIGFLVDKDNTKYFYNCKGEVLCIMNEDAGET